MNDNVFIVRDFQNFFSVTEAIENSHYKYEYVILNKKILEANKFISSKLLIPITSKVFSFEKLRIVEGKPRMIEKVYIDYQKVPGIENEDLSNGSLYSLLKEKYGYSIIKNEEDIMMVHANQYEATQLNIENNSEVLMIVGNSFAELRKPFEYYELISLPSFFRFRSVHHYDWRK